MPKNAATHWRCHQCNRENLWETTPACITCEHRPCSRCDYIRRYPSGRLREASRRTTPSMDISTRTTPVVQRPGVPQDPKEEQTSFWKCHRCLTQCPKGDDEEKDTWKCIVCHHCVCWECSASFEHAAAGMNIPSLRAALGPNPAADQQSVRLMRDGEGTSARVVTKYDLSTEASLSKEVMGLIAVKDPFTSDDNDSKSVMQHAKSSRNWVSDKTSALKELKRKLDDKTKAHQALQLKHDELLATLVLPQMPKPLVEQETVAFASLLNPETRKNINYLSVSESAELVTGPDGKDSAPSGRDGTRDTLRKTASSPLEGKMAQLSLRSFHELQANQRRPSIDEISETTGLDDEMDTPSESDGELDVAGLGSDDDSHIGSSTLVDPVLLHEIVNQLVSTYLEDVNSRHAGQRPNGATSGIAPVSHNVADATPATNSTNPSKENTATKRERLEEQDNLADKEISNKRRKHGQEPEGRKLFACPHWKVDKRRYSEHNVNEKRYRHCSSTYSVNIHRLKQHLFRVHSRPEFYCSRCFLDFKTRELFDDHSRATTLCHISECPFEERMTHDQEVAIKKRATTRDQVAIWYSIYGILFPDSRKPESPYAEDISPESVEDFEQWFMGQELVLRDLFATRITSDLPRLPQEDLHILDTALEGCLFELSRRRGRDFHLSPAEDGPSNWMAAELELHGTTAFEVATEFEMLDAHAEPLETGMSEDCREKVSGDGQEEYIANDELREFHDESSPGHTPKASTNRVQHSHWEEFSTEDWAIVNSSMHLNDNFGEYWEALGHDMNLTTVLQQYQNDDEPPEIVTEDTRCAKKQKGKDRAQERDECFEEFG